jgi:hypothetical protein
MLAAPGAGAEDAFKAAISACRPIGEAALRAACYDGVVDRSLAAQASTGAQPKPAASQAMAPAQPAEAAPRNSGTPSVHAATVASPPSEMEFGLATEAQREVTVEIANVAHNDDRKLRFTTTSGVTWDQTDDTFVRRLAPGDKVIIKETMVGGYRCKLDRHWASCKRARSEP